MKYHTKTSTTRRKEVLTSKCRKFSPSPKFARSSSVATVDVEPEGDGDDGERS